MSLRVLVHLKPSVTVPGSCSALVKVRRADASFVVISFVSAGADPITRVCPPDTVCQQQEDTNAVLCESLSQAGVSDVQAAPQPSEGQTASRTFSSLDFDSWISYQVGLLCTLSHVTL